MTGPVDALASLLADRHSCRAFLPDPVPRDTLARVFATAQRAASWCNVQPWQVTVASGAALERLRSALHAAAASGQAPDRDIPFPPAYTGVHLDRRRACGFQLYEAAGIDRADTEGRRRQGLRNFELFGAPHAAFVSGEPELGTYGAVDVGGYVQVLMLALQSHGLASIAQAAVANHSGLVKATLGIEARRHLVCAVSFGFEDASDPVNRFRTARADAQDVVRYLDD